MKTEWQPIETVPQNQTVYIYDEVEGIYPARLMLVRTDTVHPHIMKPTHWTSLPDPPSKKEETP